MMHNPMILMHLNLYLSICLPGDSPWLGEVILALLLVIALGGAHLWHHAHVTTFEGLLLLLFYGHPIELSALFL